MYPMPGCQLIERVADFSYGYRMRCDCGAAVAVSAEVYDREQSRDALVPCEACGSSVHFGPRVAMVRDENDPALNDERVRSFAWYHTSTWPDWPSPVHRSSVERRFRSVDSRILGSIDSAIERAASLALHVGTYDAAIENMLRRMRNQADGASQFYLYRVALVSEPLRTNRGFRDENNENASQIGVAELAAERLDVLRYLNVHEATGTLSLALTPAAIAAVQCLQIPILGRSLDTPSDLVETIASFESRRAVLDSTHPPQPADGRRRRSVIVTDSGVRLDDAHRDRSNLWADVERELSTHYLGGISPVVADDVCSAVRAWRRADQSISVQRYAERFAEISSLLTDPDEAISAVSQQPWREVAP